MKITIATPMYGGNCKGIYMQSVIALMEELKKRGHVAELSYIYNESLITRARNRLVYQFEQSDSDGLLFIDADQGFNATDLADMIESDKDVIGAICQMKNINWEAVRSAVVAGKENLSDYSGFFALNFFDDQQSFSVMDTVPVTEIGTGIMFIKKGVFDLLRPHCKSYMISDHTGAYDSSKMVTEYFKTEIDENGVLLSEDYYFCRLYRSFGGIVYAAPWVNVVHAGEYVFNGSFIMQSIDGML